MAECTCRGTFNPDCVVHSNLLRYHPSLAAPVATDDYKKLYEELLAQNKRLVDHNNNLQISLDNLAHIETENAVLLQRIDTLTIELAAWKLSQ